MSCSLMCTRRTLTLRNLLWFARKTGGRFFCLSDTLFVGLRGFLVYTAECHKGLVSVKSSNFFYTLQLWSHCSSPSSPVFPVVDVIWSMWLVSNSEIECGICKDKFTCGKPQAFSLFPGAYKY